jgi:hypothetical protein
MCSATPPRQRSPLRAGSVHRAAASSLSILGRRNTVKGLEGRARLMSGRWQAHACTFLLCATPANAEYCTCHLSRHVGAATCPRSKGNGVFLTACTAVCATPTFTLQTRFDLAAMPCSARYQGSKLSVSSLSMRSGGLHLSGRLNRLLELKKLFGEPSPEAAEQLQRYQHSVAMSHARDPHWKLMRSFTSPGPVMFIRPNPAHSNQSCVPCGIPAVCTTTQRSLALLG